MKNYVVSPLPVAHHMLVLFDSLKLHRYAFDLR